MDLRGKTTPGGWFIEESVTFAADHTGGHFSDCYYVTKAGQKAFLKALDIEKFDIGMVLGLLASFDYESDLVALCRMKGLSRVVQVLESGRIERDPNAIYKRAGRSSRNPPGHPNSAVRSGFPG